MNELLLELQPHLITILGIIVGYLGVKLRTLFDIKVSKDQQAMIRDIVKGSVMFVEQISKQDMTLVGQAKFEKAKSRALVIMNEKGLKISEEELETLIEEFVRGLNSEN